MPAEILSYFLKNSNLQLKTRFQVALQCAPFLKGLKVSCVISIDREMYGELEEIFKETGIEYRSLSASEEKYLILFYRRSDLESHLSQKHILRLLEEYGYADMRLEDMLDRLTKRVKFLAEKKLGFPHEIGIFLGYPLEDVEGFIKNEGRKYLMIGYWKVYSNPSEAKMIFKLYDQAKDRAVREFLAGKSIREIAGY